MKLTRLQCPLLLTTNNRSFRLSKTLFSMLRKESDSSRNIFTPTFHLIRHSSTPSPLISLYIKENPNFTCNVTFTTGRGFLYKDSQCTIEELSTNTLLMTSWNSTFTKVLSKEDLHIEKATQALSITVHYTMHTNRPLRLLNCPK